MVLRSLFFIFLYVPFMLVCIPIQFLISRSPRYSNTIPRWFHTMGARFLGMKVKVIGTPSTDRATLIVSNHVSWTDIVAIGSKADVTFVAKSEIARWPFVGFMASLQKTLYVDRKRRTDAKRASREMGARMASGGAVLLFAEGQSDIGTHVLPFRSALIGAAQHAMEDAGAGEVLIQPLTIAYTKLQGLPVGRTDRSFIAWIKSKSVKQNIREILTGGTREVTLAFGQPRPLTAGADRKQLARQAETEVRRMLVALNRGTPLPVTSGVARPVAAE
ncbi:MAG: lysophospholipid acyltransferase family protein [Devosia sp.]